MGYKYKKQKYNPTYTMSDPVQPQQVQTAHLAGQWGPGGSQPSSASIDGTHSPLDTTIVESEIAEEDAFQSNPQLAMGPGYSVDPATLHRQLTNLSYHDVSSMSDLYNQSGAFGPAVGQGWAASVPSLAMGGGYQQGNPTSMDSPIGPPLNSILSRSLSDSNMSTSTSRRGSISVTTELLGTLSMTGRDNVALLQPTGRSSRRGSLIPPPAPLRNAGRAEKLAEDVNGGWSFVPHGFIPVLFPSHVAANAEVIQTIQKYGGVFPTISRMKASEEDISAGQAKSTSQSKESSSVPTEPTEVYNLQKPRKPPRPANSFILYRRAKQDEVMKSNEGMTNNEVSRLIGQMWANEDAEVKELYKAKAEDAKRLHNLTFPDYKYAPRKPAVRSKKGNEAKKRSISEDTPDYRIPESGRQSYSYASGHTSRNDLTEDIRSPSPLSPGTGRGGRGGPAAQHHKWSGSETALYSPPYAGYFQQGPVTYQYPTYQHLPYQPQQYQDMELSTDPNYRGRRSFQYPMPAATPHAYGYSGYVPGHPSHDANNMAVRSHSAPPQRPGHLGTYPPPPAGSYGMPPQQQHQHTQPPPRPYTYQYHPSSVPGQWDHGQ
ncbi:hypothetical protein DFJ77DRAFT_466215 [Powellomyces hirtus]|nr:hypothetical protein DFJ77DRAFT_466215 [Powellomyces hirtus]